MLQRILKTVGLALWLPSLAGAATFVITWLVWFFIEPDCVPTPAAPCPLLPWGRYITLHILGECILYSALVMTALGGSDIMLFIREMMRNEEQKKAAEQQKQESAARLEQEKQESAARLEQQKQDAAAQREQDRQLAEQRLADDRQRADLMAAKQEALMERTFQLLTEERAAAAEERRKQDERIRQLETQLAQLAVQQRHQP